MLVPVEWLRDYTDVNVDIDEFCDRMIMSGSNLETVENFGEGIERVVVGKVVKKEKHPDADKLSVCMLDIGEEEPIQIVCGAQNVEEGIKVPVALHKSRIPGPFHGQPKHEGGEKVTKGKLRGVESNGMICSCGELGYDDKIVPVMHKDGIWVLPEEAEIGAPIDEALGLKGSTVDFEITPNRADCLAMVGMAREAAATFGTELRYPDIAVEEKGEGESKDYIDIEIKDQDLCNRYVGRVVTNVKIEQSPWWMQKRLMYAGMRPINNIVDITNFVMLEYGHPIHAFDIRQIKGNKIIVERAAEGEIFTTLDGQERAMGADMLLIKDAERGVAIAGVMGGQNSEIEADTTTILIEAANFDADNIRLTSKKLGLRTEASGRYEKGIDPNLCREAADRVCRLIELLGAGTVLKGAVDCYPNVKEPWQVNVRVSRVNKVLGTDFTAEDMIKTFESLEIKVERDGDMMVCTPPTIRLDLIGEEDFIEEVARMYGYDRLPMTLPKGNSESSLGRNETLRRMARGVMAGFGANEIQTYSFVSPKDADKMHLAETDPLRNVVPIINPLGEDTSVMRTMLLPGMLEVLGRNYSRNIPEVKAYEIGNTFMKISEDLNVLPKEADAMSIGMYGKDVTFFTLKGMIEELLKVMGISEVIFEKESSDLTYHPGRCAKMYIMDGEEKVYIGSMGELHPDIADEYGIGTRVYATEMFFAKIGEYAATEVVFKPLPKYPATSRDIALVVEENVAVGSVEEIITAAGGKMMESVKLFDIYRGAQVGEGKKSLAFSLTYRAEDKTLTDDDVKPVHEKVLAELKEKLNAVLREM